MHIHEYQAKNLLSQRGVPVPAGQVAASPEQAAQAFQALRLRHGLIKAQIHAGGRGKAGGVVMVHSPKESEDVARRLLGKRLVTAQTGPMGMPVEKVLVQEAVEIEREMYLSVSLDRDRGCPMLMASPQGGMEIEELARRGALHREYGNPVDGFEPFQARKVAEALELPHTLLKAATEMILALGQLYVQKDCSLIELNPLAQCRDGRLLALDVKMSFEDSGLHRHPEIADLRDPGQQDPREVKAALHDLSYVGLDGNIGCMVNGAGLAMATMDVILLNGGRPANFLDVGGDATVAKVVAAFELLCDDPNVAAILVNIFGGIVRCDVVAQGILGALKRVTLRVPLVVRLEGTRAAEGRELLARSGLQLVSAEGLNEAAVKVVASASGSAQEAR